MSTGEQNSAVQNESGFFSLAELAALQTDAVPVLMSLVPAVGVYRCKGIEVKGGEGKKTDENADKPPLYYFNFVMEILSAKVFDKTIDPETLVGRKLTDSYTLWPNQFQDLIGLLKGRYKILGLPNTGPRMGGIEGQEPGWLDSWTNADITVKISHWTDKTGNTRARFTYMAPESQAEGTAAA